MEQQNGSETPSTTGEVARLLGVSKTTLLRWLRVGYIPEPPFVQVGRVRMRLWRKSDLTRALYHRKFYLWHTKDELNESAKRSPRIPDDVRNCGIRSSDSDAS